jgi:RimJ/RimL family protein N-acetyltransferase
MGAEPATHRVEAAPATVETGDRTRDTGVAATGVFSGPPVRGYPADLARTAFTRDGRRLDLRPIRPDDAGALVAFHGRLSPVSVYRRFFAFHPTLSAAEVERFTRVDYGERLALVAHRNGQLIAVARYDQVPETSEAEVAFVVADAEQHQGIATLLLEQLADAAWLRGITTFTAQTLADNRDMLDVFRDSGFAVHCTLDHGIALIRFSIEQDEGYRATRRLRHRDVEVVAGEPTSRPPRSEPC